MPELETDAGYDSLVTALAANPRKCIVSHCPHRAATFQAYSTHFFLYHLRAWDTYCPTFAAEEDGSETHVTDCPDLHDTGRLLCGTKPIGIR